MLIGERVLVRRAEEGDADAVWAWYQDPALLRYFTPHGFFTRTQIKEFLARTSRSSPEDSARVDFIVENKLGKPVGLADLTAISHYSRHATFSIAIDTRFKNQGCGVDATILILHFAFSELNLLKVSIHTYDGNSSVYDMAVRFGFQQEGRLVKEDFFEDSFHDLIYLSIFKDAFYESPLVRRAVRRFKARSSHG